MRLEHEDLTHAIIGAAIAVHRALGPGFVESVYEHALAIELTAQGIPFRQQVRVPVRDRGSVVGSHRLDLVVDGTIVVELKATRDLCDTHFSIVRSYLQAVGLKHGLLLDFAKPALEKRRVLAADAMTERPCA